MKFTWKKIACAVCCLIFLVTVPISVSANTITQDGIEASFTTDKTTYKDTDSVTVTLQIKNGTTTPIGGITLTNVAPDGYVDSSQTQEKIENYTLESGETVSISTTFIKSATGILSPKTGDKDSIIVLTCLIVVGVVFVCIAYKKNKRSIIAMLLCLCLLETIVPSIFIEEIKAARVTVSKTINLNTVVKVNEAEIQFCASVKYDHETDEEIVEGNISDDTNSNVSDYVLKNESNTKIYTRGEWIRLLLDKMEARRVNVADADYVYHFTDTENGAYGVDAETAWAYSILPEENVNMPVFNENAIVTREYAAYTVYHIMGFEGNYVATCADAEQLEYPNEVALISAEGFISLNNQCFEPKTNLCESDVVQIFAMIDNYNDSLYVDFDNQVYNITYADRVIEISSTNYEVIKNADGTYSITLPVNEQTSALVEGSVIVLPQNENNDALGLKVNSIGITASSVTLLCSEPAMDELLASYDIAGYGTSISSNTIETPEGVSVEYSEETISNSNLATYDIDTSSPNLGKLKFTLGGDKCPYSGTVEVSIPQIQVRLKGNGADVEECSWLMKTTTKIHGSVSVGTYLKPEGGSKFYLTPNGIDIPVSVGVSVNVKIYLYYSVDGSVTIGYETTNIVGCQYKNGTLRYISDMSSGQITKPTTEFSAEAKLGVGIAGALNILCMINVVQLDATVGGCISAKQTVHNDISPALHCNQIAEYLFFDISLDKKSLIGDILDKVNISWKKTIWKETNSPFSLMIHLENGVEVPSCTYGYGHLIGTVIDSSTGEAIGNAQIVFKDKKSETIIQTVYSSTTEDAVSELKVGDFIGKSLPAGEYSVEVSADDYKSVCVDATVKKDERTEIGTISLEAVSDKDNDNEDSDGGEEGGGNGDQDDPVIPTDYYKIVDVSLGVTTCAIVTDDGSLYMWGDNEYGQLGNGTTEDSSEPIKILDNVKTVMTDDYTSGALLNDGSLYMWGQNRFGQVGNGTTENSDVPIKVLDHVYKLLEVGNTCMAITENYDLYVWGEQNWQCTIGDESFQGENLLVPTRILGNIKDAVIESGYRVVTTSGVLEAYSSAYPFVPALSGSSDHRIIKRDVKCVFKGQGRAWGFLTSDDVLYGYDYDYSNLGGQYDSSIGYARLMENVKDISFADDRAVIRTDGSLYMWGFHCGYNEPTYIRDDIKDVCVVYKKCAFITMEGELYIWEYDEMNQSNMPVLVQIERQ